MMYERQQEFSPGNVRIGDLMVYGFSKFPSIAIIEATAKYHIKVRPAKWYEYLSINYIKIVWSRLWI